MKDGLSFRIPDDVKEVLMKLAEQDDRSLSSYIRRLLEQHAREAVEAQK